MDNRTVMVLLLLGLGGCGRPAYGPAMTSQVAGLTPEARAELAIERTADTCAERPELCAQDEDDVLEGIAWEYPDVQVPDSVRRFPTSHEQEVGSVGVTLGVSLSEQHTELDRGTTLTYPGNVDP